MANEVYPVIEESARTRDGKEWVHKPCGTILLGKTVHLSVRDGLFPLSGTGEVVRETVPYCPTCETEPSSHGTTNSVDVDANEREILRRMRENRS